MNSDSLIYSTSMWVMEFLVLGLIAYEVVIGIIGRRASHRRKLIVDERVEVVRAALSKGEHLLSSVPTDNPKVEAWAQAVSNWGEETRSTLRSFSAQAETAFLIHKPGSPNAYGSIQPVYEYMMLLSRIENLRGIMEKPEVYS